MVSQGVNREEKLKRLKEELVRYQEILRVKARNFKGVRHENSLSELRYTEYMVYRDMVAGLEKEIRELEAKK